jgi:potassium-transporting ATPase KdpC subunit
MKKQVLISVKILLMFSLVTGIIYPVFITALANLLFKDKANGSLIKKNDQVIGSSLIGQAFDSSAYFWPRSSAIGYNPLPSGGSNLGLTNEKIRQQLMEREQYFLRGNSLPSGTHVPSEMVFASGSGLDPHISPEAVFLQVDRIAKARNFSINQRNELLKLITKLIEEPQFHLFGQERINVFMLNLELDKIDEYQRSY